LRGRIVKQSSAVPVADASERWIGQQFAFGVFQYRIITASHHQPQGVCKHGTIARESSFKRRSLGQLESTAGVAIANGRYKII
jgi:hypothetical protein